MRAALKELNIVHSESNSIHLNLAIEESLCQNTQLAGPLLYLWRNSKTIVIGNRDCRAVPASQF